MSRHTLIALLAAAAGPWSGCDRNLDPVTPPAEPPAERAPGTVAPREQPSGGGILLLTTTRRLV